MPGTDAGTELSAKTPITAAKSVCINVHLQVTAWHLQLHKQALAHTISDPECLFISWLNILVLLDIRKGWFPGHSPPQPQDKLFCDKVLIQREWELTVARVEGSISSVPLPRKSRGRVRSVCVCACAQKGGCRHNVKILRPQTRALGPSESRPALPAFLRLGLPDQTLNLAAPTFGLCFHTLGFWEWHWR